MPDTVIDQQIVDDSSTVSTGVSAQHPTDDIMLSQSVLSPSGSVPDFGQSSTADPSLNTETHHLRYDLRYAANTTSRVIFP